MTRWCMYGALVHYTLCTMHSASTWHFFIITYTCLDRWQNDTWWIARLLKLLTAAEKSLHSKSQSILNWNSIAELLSCDIAMLNNFALHLIVLWKYCNVFLYCYAMLQYKGISVEKLQYCNSASAAAAAAAAAVRVSRADKLPPATVHLSSKHLLQAAPALHRSQQKVRLKIRS